MKDEEWKPAYISSSGFGEVTIKNLNDEEIKKIREAFFGQHWLTVEDGRIKAIDARIALPKPAADEKMLPFWRLVNEKKGKQLALLEKELSIAAQETYSIIIQHLCGYYYTPESFKEQAEKLESYGFDCLRSRRGDEGQFWEIWYLPGLWAARGELDLFLKEEKSKNKVKLAVGFLCRNVSFGTLDLATQRVAMSHPD